MTEWRVEEGAKRRVARLDALSWIVLAMAGLWLVAFGLSPALAQCNTAPTTLQYAVETHGEAVVVDVLADAGDLDGEALAVAVLSHDCPGTVSEGFGLVRYAPFAVADCNIGFRITDERGLAKSSTIHVTGVVDPSSIFSDGFETGDTSRWSSACSGACP